MADIVSLSDRSLQKLAEIITQKMGGSSRSLSGAPDRQRPSTHASNQDKQDQKSNKRIADGIEDQLKELAAVRKALHDLKIKNDSAKTNEEKAQQRVLEDQMKILQEQSKLAVLEDKQQRRSFKASAESFKSHKNFNSSTASLALVTSQLGDYIRTDWDAVNKLNYSMNRSLTSQTSLLNGMIEASGLENDAYDKYISKLLDSSRSLTTFGMAAKNAGTELHTAHDLSKVIQDLTQEVGLMEKMAKKLKGTGQPIDKFISGLYAMEQAGEDLSDEQRQMLKAARNAKLIDDNGKVASAAAFNNHIKAVKEDIFQVQKTAQWEIMMHKMYQKSKDHLGVFGKALEGNITPLGLFASGLAMIGASLTGVWDQAKVAADTGFAYSEGFEQIQKSSVLLGLNFEQTAKLMQANRQILGNGTTDLNRFANALNVGQEGLRQFGVVNSEEAAQAVEGFIQNMAKGGIDIKNQESLNKSIEMQTKAFGKLKATTGASLAEFKQLNEELMGSSAVQAELNGLNQADRAARLEQNLRLRQSFVDMQMSASDANKAMLAMKEQGKEKVTTRFDQAAKLMQAANVAGLGNGKRLYELYLKGARRSKEETLELVKGWQAITKQADQAAQSGNVAKENAMQVMIEQVPGMQALTDLARNAGLKEQAAPKQDTQALLAQVNNEQTKAIGEVKGAIDSMKSVLENPLVKMAAGLTAVAVGLGGIVKSANVITGIQRKANTWLEKIAMNTGDDYSDGSGGKKGRKARKKARKATAKGGKIGKLAKFGKAAGSIGGKVAGGLIAGAGPALAMYEGFDMMSDAYSDVQAKKAAKAAGGDISERTMWNDLGMIIPPSILPNFLTELDEYDQNGKRRIQPQLASPVSKQTSALGAPVPSGSPNSTSSDLELNAPVMKLTAETIKSIVDPIIQLLATENKSLNIEEQQLAMLMSLVDSDAKASEAAEKLSHGETLSFTDDWQKRNFIAYSG